MKNPDRNYKIILIVVIIIFLAFLYWAANCYKARASHYDALMPEHTLADDNAREMAAWAAKARANDDSIGMSGDGTDLSQDANIKIAHDNSDKTKPTTTYAPYGEANPAKTFSIIVMPDTQIYARDFPKTFCEQTEWIAANKAKLNIQFVSQLGDIVNDHKDRLDEWETASKCMKVLDDAKIPYGIIPGNHDTDGQYREDGMSTYDKYFPASRYAANYWYKGYRKNNQNNYEIINVEVPNAGKAKTIQLLFLNLEIEPSDNTIAWANDVMKKNPDIYTIVTTHKYLPDNAGDLAGRLDAQRLFSQTGNMGQDIWNKLVKNNCSIQMVWNGHFHETDGEFMNTNTNSCGKPVQQIIQNYQAREEGGNGRLRIYTFDPIVKKIKAQTYSPTTKTYEADADSQFELPFAI